MDRSIIDFWDKFEFVGNSYDDRVIWAVGQVKPDSMCLGNGVIVTELHHKGELTPENLPPPTHGHILWLIVGQQNPTAE